MRKLMMAAALMAASANYAQDGGVQQWQEPRGGEQRKQQLVCARGCRWSNLLR